MPSIASYRFGSFLLDATSYRLQRDGEIVSLSPKIIDLLLYFVARPSALVTKEELFKALWPDVAVTDNALTQAVSELRQALGDDPANPRFIQTVGRRGYLQGLGLEAIHLLLALRLELAVGEDLGPPCVSEATREHVPGHGVATGHLPSSWLLRGRGVYRLDLK